MKTYSAVLLRIGLTVHYFLLGNNSFFLSFLMQLDHATIFLLLHA